MQKTKKKTIAPTPEILADARSCRCGLCNEWLAQNENKVVIIVLGEIIYALRTTVVLK
jgi:hypothetical protein